MKINWKDKKTWIIIGVVVLLIVVAVVLIRRNKTNEEENDNSGSGSGSNSGSGNSSDTTFPLKQGSPLSYSAAGGSYGWPVTLIQTCLNDLYGAGLTVDGKFGTKTMAALKENFAVALGDNEITQDEFSTMLDTFRVKYSIRTQNPITYETNDDLIKVFKK